ncbi:MAG: hypothetical protein KAS30_06070 [Candidatus Diapherotrites archaeon]|nr:hypothetical protein [Candidatus Diapherotrites archaeon]
MKKPKDLYDLIDYLQIKIISLQYLELQHKNKKAGELWELNTEENSRFIQEYIFLLSMIKEMPEAEKIKHVIKTRSRLSEMSFEMMSEELRKQALKEELKNKKAIENELKKFK